MKIIKICCSFLLIVLISIATISCKKEVKKEPVKFSIEQKTITINWTAYKTTDKVAVKGKFEEIIVTNHSEHDTSIEALNGVQFEIPISSINSNDEGRDNKLKQFFFGVMDATLSLTGTLHLGNDGTGNIDLKMNGMEQKIPIKYIASGQMVEITGIMNLENWNTTAAITSLNEACLEKHKGTDGVSKTWTEVAIEAKVYLRKK